MKAKKTYCLLISGRVQGVGFRYFAQAKARGYGITGYVRNTMDNKVEIYCQGFQDSIERFIAEMGQGPSFSMVEHVDRTEIHDAKDFNLFDIRYSSR